MPNTNLTGKQKQWLRRHFGVYCNWLIKHAEEVQGDRVSPEAAIVRITYQEFTTFLKQPRLVRDVLERSNAVKAAIYSYCDAKQMRRPFPIGT